ncbi:TonB-dependent receptor plug domain-containing protein [Nitratireductor aquibiodomus]|uniref:TonB-dependent receptor plug domain-containing protein n=1 Tax=Nitratireductor aquibiodomus TaxID=204799 RepID=UPI000304724E|nr:TonB-dependent receptor plug domain-containing protein [Nitratireductor aquibiodomus]
MFKILRESASSVALAMAVLGPASAQEGGGGGTTLETITISGELIERSWLRTGTSVQGLDEKQLKERPALETVRDVLEDTVNMTTPTGAAKAPTVRGVDGTGPAENANAFFAGSRARLGLRIDGRPASYNEIVFGNPTLWDVDTIEVLRGPQSTLVGRNAIAGTVVVKTKDPVFAYSGAVETSIGKFDGRRVSGMINLPIIDNVLAARLSADIQSGTSAVSYDAFPGVDNPGDIRAHTLRGKLLAKPDLGLDSTCA